MSVDIEIDANAVMADIKTSAKYALEQEKDMIVSDIDKYVPYKTGRTSRSGYDSAEIDDMTLNITYEGIDVNGFDYTDNIYYGVSSTGKSMQFVPNRNPNGNPYAGSYWDERAIEDNNFKWKNDICDFIEERRAYWREQKAHQREAKRKISI